MKIDDHRDFEKRACKIRVELHDIIITTHKRWRHRLEPGQPIDFSSLKIAIHDEITQKGLLEQYSHPWIDIHFPGLNPHCLRVVPVIDSSPGDLIEDGILISNEGRGKGICLCSETNATNYYVDASIADKKHKFWICASVRFSTSSLSGVK